MHAKSPLSPQPFVIRQECERAAGEHGFRIPRGEQEGWAAFSSTTAPATLWLGAGGDHGPWFMAHDHPGVMAEFGIPPEDMPGPGIARYAFENLNLLYAALRRFYQLAISLPAAPLKRYQEEVRKPLPSTEVERLAVQRIGQDIFRESLLQYWQGRCPLTGITDQELLRASHIIPWSECESDAERLDVHNGLLLSALWDAAFDRNLVSFSDDGTPIFSDKLGLEARKALYWEAPLPLTPQHKARLARHRERLK